MVELDHIKALFEHINGVFLRYGLPEKKCSISPIGKDGKINEIGKLISKTVWGPAKTSIATNVIKRGIDPVELAKQIITLRAQRGYAVAKMASRSEYFAIISRHLNPVTILKNWARDALEAEYSLVDGKYADVAPIRYHDPELFSGMEFDEVLEMVIPDYKSGWKPGLVPFDRLSPLNQQIVELASTYARSSYNPLSWEEYKKEGTKELVAFA